MGRVIDGLYESACADAEKFAAWTREQQRPPEVVVAVAQLSATLALVERLDRIAYALEYRNDHIC